MPFFIRHNLHSLSLRRAGRSYRGSALCVSHSAAGGARHCTRGLTLIELLVVIAIVAILGAIIGAGINGVRRQVDSTRCLSNLRQIGMAYSAFLQDQKGLLPPYYDPTFEGGAAIAALRPYVGIKTNEPPVYGVFACPAAVSILTEKYPTNAWFRNSYFQNRNWAGFARSEAGRKNIKTFNNPSKAILVYERWGQNDTTWLTPNCHTSSRNILYMDLHVEADPKLVERSSFAEAITEN